MKISPVSYVCFRANNSPKVNKTKVPEEDLQFKKGKKKIMHRAFAFSAIMLAGTVAYFKKIS